MRVQLSWNANGRAGIVTVTAKAGDETLAVDTFNVTKEESRAAFRNGLMEKRPGSDATDIDAQLLRIAAEVASKLKAPPEADSTPHPDPLAAMPAVVCKSARQMLESSDLLTRIGDDIERLGVAGERELAMTVYLAGVSRLLPHPLALIVQGSTSSGKSYTVARVASLFPPETVIHATQMTPQALYHMKPGSLKNRFVVAGERSRRQNDDTADCTKALREMLSDGWLRKLVPEKAGCEIVTRHIEQEGPIAYVETTTLAHIFDEDLNRCHLLHTDESTEQTRRILDTLAHRYEAGGQTADVQEIIERHHAAQRMLRAVRVIVPYAVKLTEALPLDKVELRRAYPLLVGCVQASALLHQFQRKLDADGNVIADRNDYALARRLLAGPIAERLGGRLPDAAMSFLDRLRCEFGESDFTSADARRKVKAGRTAVNGWLSQLGEAGLLEIVDRQHGNKPAVWKVIGDVDDADAASYLPTPEMIV